MKSLLVIGGSGFFGKSILSAYQKGLLEPWGISKLFVMARNASQLKKSQSKLLAGAVSLIDSDITICDELPYSDFVIHAASSTDARNYSNNPEMEKNNIIAGANNYIRLAKKFHRKSKIVYCSSGAIYGQTSPDIHFISESLYKNTSINSASNKLIYASAKQNSEHFFQLLGLSDMSVSIARCFAFVGPFLPRNQHFAIGNFIEDVVNQRPIEIKATHKVYRSYMYADELVIWLMTIAASANSSCPVFNVGSGEAVELHELAKRIACTFNLPVKSSQIIDSEHVDRYIPDVSKAEKELGLKIKIDLDAAIKLTISNII
jgi:dTDP-glucose 4,6-dehydratase